MVMMMNMELTSKLGLNVLLKDNLGWCSLNPTTGPTNSPLNEPHREKTGLLPMRKRRPAVQ